MSGRRIEGSLVLLARKAERDTRAVEPLGRFAVEVQRAVLAGEARLPDHLLRLLDRTLEATR